MARRFRGRSREGGFLWKILPATLVLIAGVLGVLAFLTYRLINPPPAQESTNPSHYWMTWSDVTFPNRSGTMFPAWWIKGRKDAPAIVLAPGYAMSRSDVLSLASALNRQGQGYHALVYDQRGSGELPQGISCLGLCETDDLIRALDFVKRQPEVDAGRIGIWGVDIGGRAALRAAAAQPEVKALVVDSVFDSTADFIDYQNGESLGLNSRFLNFGCNALFQLLRLGLPVSRYERLELNRLSDRSVLLIEGDNRREFAQYTAALYGEIRPTKQLLRLPLARVRNMSGGEAESYDRQVVAFFSLNLP